MASRIAYDEIPAGIDAYHPDNRVIVAVGPLTGTLAPTSGRTVVSGISPRTYPTPWYTHSTLGGWFGPELKYAGFDAIIIHGSAVSPVLLALCDGEAQIVDVAELYPILPAGAWCHLPAKQVVRVVDALDAVHSYL